MAFAPANAVMSQRRLAFQLMWYVEPMQVAVGPVYHI